MRPISAQTILNRFNSYTKQTHPSSFVIPRLRLYIPNYRLVCVTARPGMGTTAFLMDIIRHNSCKYDQPVLAYFNSFSNQHTLMNRFIAIASLSPFKSDKYNFDDETCKTEKEKYLDELDKKNIPVLHNVFKKSKIYFSDLPSNNPNAFIRKLRSDIAKTKPAYIIMDDLHLLSNLKYFDEINDVVKLQHKSQSLVAALYNFQKSNSIPIIFSIPQTRDMEYRGGWKYPEICFILDPAAQYYSDAIITLYRPDFYGIEEDEESKMKNRFDIHLVKNNVGDEKQIRVVFKPGYSNIFSETEFPD